MRRRLDATWRRRCELKRLRIARRASSSRCVTSGKAAARPRLLLRLNEAVVLQLNVVVVHQQSEAVVLRRIVDAARARYRVQRRRVNSRVTIAVSQRHGQSVRCGRSSNDRRRNA